MPEELPKPSQRPWDGGNFVLLLFLFLPALDIASIYGGRAHDLGIPGAEIAQAAPFLMVAAFLFVPLILVHGPLARWRHGITLCVVFLCLMFPSWLLSHGSVRVPLSRPMSHEEVMKLRDTFKIPTLQCSDSGEGNCLRLRLSDYTEPVRSYVANMVGVTEDAPSSR